MLQPITNEQQFFFKCGFLKDVFNKVVGPLLSQIGCLKHVIPYHILGIRLSLNNLMLQNQTNFFLLFSVTCYKMQVTSCYIQVKTYKLQVTSYKLQATSYKLQVTSY
jgi:hypothetical protein